MPRFHVDLDAETDRLLRLKAHQTGARSKSTMARMILMKELKNEVGAREVNAILATPPEPEEQEQED